MKVKPTYEKSRQVKASENVAKHLAAKCLRRFMSKPSQAKSSHFLLPVKADEQAIECVVEQNVVANSSEKKTCGTRRFDQH